MHKATISKETLKDILDYLTDAYVEGDDALIETLIKVLNQTKDGEVVHIQFTKE